MSMRCYLACSVSFFPKRNERFHRDVSRGGDLLLNGIRRPFELWNGFFYINFYEKRIRSLFSDIGVYAPCGIFTSGHFILLGITLLCIAVALRFSRNMRKEQVYRVILWTTVVLWVLEILKIIYNIRKNSVHAINTYVPLYYCSILLYAGLFSSFGRGMLKRAGDVALSTGAIVGGIVFLIYPSTSLPTYPAFHFLSIHSFFYHGEAIFLGILMNRSHYIDLKKTDITYFSGLMGIMCALAFLINQFFQSNLMFISQNFPGTPLEILYRLTDGNFLYSVILIAVQITLPFYVPYWVIQRIQGKRPRPKC